MGSVKAFGTVTFVSSLAGTNAQYVAAQMKIDNGVFHLQVAGPQGNREYGFAANYNVTPELIKWFKGQSGNSKSLASGTFGYVPVRIRVDSEDSDKVRFQAQGVPSLNREYGAAFTIKAADLAEYLSVNA